LQDRELDDRRVGARRRAIADQQAVRQHRDPQRPQQDAGRRDLRDPAERRGDCRMRGRIQDDGAHRRLARAREVSEPRRFDCVERRWRVGQLGQFGHHRYFSGSTSTDSGSTAPRGELRHL
jgi:hypothetical protein